MSGTLIVAILGLISGGLAFAWQVTAQVVTWTRGRPRVMVSSGYTYLAQGDPPEVGQYLRVTARNVGGAATAVEAWGIETPTGGAMRFEDPKAPSAPLPSRLEPHTSATWYIAAEGHHMFCEMNDFDPGELRSWVLLMSGEVIFDESPWGAVRLRPGVPRAAFLLGPGDATVSAWAGRCAREFGHASRTRR